MDVFLIRNGVVENVIVVPSLNWAQAAYPGYTIVERSEENKHLNIGDTV